MYSANELIKMINEALDRLQRIVHHQYTESLTSHNNYLEETKEAIEKMSQVGVTLGDWSNIIIFKKGDIVDVQAEYIVNIPELTQPGMRKELTVYDQLATFCDDDDCCIRDLINTAAYKNMSVDRIETYSKGCDVTYHVYVKAGRLEIANDEQ